MAAITSQYTESNLVGTLNSSVSKTDATILVTFFDRITGLPRAPQSNTKIYVTDKGTEAYPNKSYELIYAGTVSTDANNVTTLGSVIRGLPFYGTAETATGTAYAHVAGAEIGCADSHLLWNILSSILDGTNSPVGFKLGTTIAYELAGALNFRSFVDSTARDAALSAPIDGETCVLTGTGVAQYYLGGSWHNFGNTGTTNASETVAGSIELATNAEMRTGTSTGGTGARLVPPNDQLIATSSGAGDQGKIFTLNSSGQIPVGFINQIYTLKSTLSAKGSMYVASGASTPAEQTVGSNGQLLVADSTQANGVIWQTLACKTGKTNAGSGTQNIAHGLGRIPKSVNIRSLLNRGASVYTIDLCEGDYDGSSMNYRAYQVLYTSGTANSADGTDKIINVIGLSASATITVDATNIILAWAGTPTNVTLTWKVWG